MSNLTIKKKPFSIIPTSFDEAMKLAEIIAKSSLCPKAYKDRPGDVLIAVQMGAEVGLSPMQAVQNIAVINGQPSIWGDAALALVKASPSFEYIDEKTFGIWPDKNTIASCIVKRKRQPAIERKFSHENAVRAQLLNKDNWMKYPERMLQMRARSWALRDMFPDVLKGLSICEEAIDIPTSDYKEVTKTNPNNLEGVDLLKHVLDIPTTEEEALPEEPKEKIALHEELKTLIYQNNVPETVVTKWLNKAEVENIEGLPETYAKKCIDSLRAKLAQ